MKFEFYDGPQQTPEWFAIRLGKVTASRLSDWMSVSKRDGKPLKARSDYEREIMFERQFNTMFERFVSGAMQDGIDYEEFACKQYERITGNTVLNGGAYYNDLFCASPDGRIDKDVWKNEGQGGLEIKWLKDTAFTEVLECGVPSEYISQIQGGLFASGRKWWDFVAGNLNTKKIKIIRVYPDPLAYVDIEKSIQEPITAGQFDMCDVYDFVIDESITDNNLGF